MKYLWYFSHGTRGKCFGPYETQDDAKEAFQRRFGYWPEDAYKNEEYYGTQAEPGDR